MLHGHRFLRVITVLDVKSVCSRFQITTASLTLPDMTDLAVDLVQHASKLFMLCLWHNWQTVHHCTHNTGARQVWQQQQQSDTSSFEAHMQAAATVL
jgi:hypothetical protein